MQIEVFKSKIHRAVVTEANLNYVGSITIDEDLMEAANIIENEKVQVVNINNGERLETYVIKGKRGSGVCCLNGPAARKAAVGDIVIIIAYATMDFEEAKLLNHPLFFPKREINGDVRACVAFTCTTMNKRVLILLQYLFFLGLGIFLVWWSVKDIDNEKWPEIRLALKNARFYLGIPVFIILLLSHFVRALRWRLLIEPLGYKPDKANTFFAVMIGYLANQAFPRLGEVLKCTLLARYEKIPADKLVGTIILERLIDAISLLMIFGITLIIQPGLYSKLADNVFNNAGEDEAKKIPAYVFGLILIGIIVALSRCG